MMRFSKKALVVSAALMCFLFLKATECISAEPLPPANNLCVQAIGPLSVPSVTMGTTIDATFDDVGACGAFNDNTAPGVWYTVVGTGKRITASTCDPQPDYDTYDTKISVFCRSCDEPICIDGNDDDCSDGASPFLSTVTWCSQAGAEYLILVHGFESEVGDFKLFLSEDDQACEPELQCIPVGACCLADSCLDSLTQVECEEVGGLYQGDDTLCEGGLVYAKEDSDNEFEDISGSGIESAASNCDDCGEVVPLDFEFNFYGDTHTDIGVSSNGYLTFEEDLEDLEDSTNDRIPNTNKPNDLIAPYWADWIPSAGGTVHYQTLETAPNRRFIAQWTKVKHFTDDTTSTFQAILFEGTNCIEFRYGSLTEVSQTIGIENQDGTKGIDVTADESTGFRFCPELIDPIECIMEVSLDIKPTSCPNPLNIKSRGVIPAAILGTEYFDVSEVDVSTVQLEDVEPLRWSQKDVASPFEPMMGKVDCREDCNNLGPDGFMDLALKFDTQEIVKALGEVEDRECLTLQLTGNLLDGTAIVGEDVVVILKKGRPWFKKYKKKKKGKD
jgi:hypothetical protein